MLACLLVAIASIALAPSSVLAATGDLLFAGCVKNSATDGCTAATHASLGSGIGVAVSPDGKNLYMASLTGNSVTQFTRAANGSLTFSACFANGGANGCQDPSSGNSPLSGAFSLAVSPDGKNVYVASLNSASISRFNRATSGALTFVECWSSPAANGCTDPDPGFAPLQQIRGVAVSPDGKDVYTSSNGFVTHFTRTPVGHLAFSSCIQGGSGGSNCTAAGGTHNQLHTAAGITLSHDGKNLYVASIGDGGSENRGSISWLDRAADGSITFAGCLEFGIAMGCTQTVNDPLDGASGVAVSPDGKSVYVAATNANSLSRLNRAADGSLTFVGCAADGGSNGCTDPSSGHDPLKNAFSVATSSDGKSLYVASSGATSITQFNRLSSGAVTFAHCFANQGLHGCTDPSPGNSNELSAFGVAVSPDSGSVYLAGSGSISWFARSTPPDTKITRSTVQAALRKASFSFVVIGQASGFQCALKKGTSTPTFTSCTSPKAYKNLTHGSYTFMVRAVNANGPDPTPARKTFVI